MDITEVLQEAIKTTQARHAVYGESYEMNGEVLRALYPNGIHLDTAKELTAFYFFFMMITKLIRYRHSVESANPHLDSIHDLGIYALMIEQYHRNKQLEDGNLPKLKDLAQGICEVLDQCPKISAVGQDCNLRKGHAGCHSFELGQGSGPLPAKEAEAEPDLRPEEVSSLMSKLPFRIKCNVAPPNNSWTPCGLRRGHDGPHMNSQKRCWDDPIKLGV